MNSSDLKKERKKLIKAIPVLLILLPIVVSVSAAISGITFGVPNGEWYSLNTAVFHFKLNIVFSGLLIIAGVYRYATGHTLQLVGFLYANIFAVFLGRIAINLVRPSLPSWEWLIPLILMYPAVSVLPFVNQGISSFLHKELFAPKTKFGRNLLWALPAMGVTGATLSQMARGFANGLIGFAIIGLVFHLLLVWQTASFSQQIWAHWQNEKHKENM